MTRVVSALLALTLALPAQAQVEAPPTEYGPDPRPGLLEAIAPDRIGDILAGVAIGAIRAVAEVTYEHLSTDLLRGRMSLSGVVVRPALEWDSAGQCRLTVERASLGTDFIDRIAGRSAASVNLVGVTMTAACLEPDVAAMVRAAGLQTLAVDQARLSLTYDQPTGEIAGEVSLAVNGIAALDVAASGTPVSTFDPTFYRRSTGVRLTSAVATLRDLGGWAVLSPMLPGELRDPEAIRAMGTQALTDALAPPQGGTVSAVERNFIDTLMARVADFVRQPGEITVEADLPPAGVVINPDAIEGPADLIVALGLTARVAPSARSALMGAEALAGLSDPEALTPDARLDLARALLAGRGVPRAPSSVPALVRPLLDTADHAPQAALLLATAQSGAEPLRAYEAALQAASGGAEGSVVLLDRLEERIGTVAALDAQARTGRPEPDPVAILGGSGDPRRLRSAALDAFYGLGTARSWHDAYYLALLAEAAGDVAAPSLLSEIAGRFEARGPEVAAAWAETRAQAEGRALDDWIALGLPALISAE